MKAVVFDMDGVLFDTERIYIESWRETAKEKGIEDMEPLIIECIGLNRTDTIRTFQEHYGTDFDFEDFRAGYTEKIQSILKKEGLPVKPGALKISPGTSCKSCGCVFHPDGKSITIPGRNKAFGIFSGRNRRRQDPAQQTPAGYLPSCLRKTTGRPCGKLCNRGFPEWYPFRLRRRYEGDYGAGHGSARARGRGKDNGHKRIADCGKKLV